MNTRKPIIGVNLDYYPNGGMPAHPLIHGRGYGYSRYAHHAITHNYLASIEKAGGVPLGLPHAFSAIDTYVNMVDGFLFTGGLLDIPPHYYGEEVTSDTLYNEDQRARFDIELCQKALATGKPILGICAGAQLLNVVTGGTLYQHIPDHFTASDIEHFDFERKHEFVHPVTITPGSKLYGIVGGTDFQVNSSHHMAVKGVGKNTRVVATAPDGVPEAIEVTNHPFALGVQWHPEFFHNGGHLSLFEALVKAAHPHG